MSSLSLLTGRTIIYQTVRLALLQAANFQLPMVSSHLPLLDMGLLSTCLVFLVSLSQGVLQLPVIMETGNHLNLYVIKVGNPVFTVDLFHVSKGK